MVYWLLLPAAMEGKLYRGEIERGIPSRKKEDWESNSQGQSFADFLQEILLISQGLQSSGKSTAFSWPSMRHMRPLSAVKGEN